MNAHTASKMKRILARARAGVQVEAHEFPNFDEDFQDITLGEGGVLELLQNMTLNEVLARPFSDQDTPVKDTEMIQEEKWLLDPLSLKLAERFYDIEKGAESKTEGLFDKNGEGSLENLPADHQEEDEQSMLPVGQFSLLQDQLTASCLSDPNPALCRFRMDFVKDDYSYPPLDNFDTSAGPEVLDSCQGGGCLTRGNLYQTILPFLQTTRTDHLKSDAQSKLFSSSGREDFVRPLTQQQYSSVPEESLDFQNFILNVEQLQQSRLNRKEAGIFRAEIKNQSIFDGIVGILFLLVLAYRMIMALWGYLDLNWFQKKEVEKSVKKQRDAEELYNNLVQLAGDRT